MKLETLITTSLFAVVGGLAYSSLELTNLMVNPEVRESFQYFEIFRGSLTMATIFGVGGYLAGRMLDRI